jgi:hypothetical protein
VLCPPHVQVFKRESVKVADVVALLEVLFLGREVENRSN